MKIKRVAVAVWVVLCGAGLAAGQTLWQQYPGNPIIEPGPPGSWDEWGSAVLAVVHHNGMFHMWYTSITPANLPADIGHATSADGFVWTKDTANPVLTRGSAGEWDGLFVYGAAVIHDGTQFHMWYQGCSVSPQINRAGYATSPDGSVWTKYSGNPVMDEGSPGSWEAWGVSPRTVIQDGDRYRMWYTGFGQEPLRGPRVFYAESSDGISWTKHGSPVLDHSEAGWDSEWVGRPAVIFDGSTYHMFYVGRDDPDSSFEAGSSIGYASSSDGLAWTRYHGNPVVEASTGYAHNSAVVFDGSAFHMWYSYWDGAVTDFVGYATSQAMASIRFIPAAAVAAGAHGAFFRTDLDVSNAGDQSATYRFTWLPRGEDNSDPLTSDSFSLGVGMSVRYENVLDAVFGLEPDSLGAVAITASSPDLLAISRTYNLPSGDSAGSYGQAMPAIPVDQLITTGERRRVLFGTEHADMRTNVGCQNGSDHTITINLELFDADGTSLETVTMMLPPLGNNQINRIFEDYAPVTGAVDVWTDDADSVFYCYGSVLDNVTSDPTTIPPQ